MRSYKKALSEEALLIGPLHDPVIWYKITHAGEQVAQWDFQNKGRSRWTGMSCFVLEVPLYPVPNSEDHLAHRRAYS